MEKNGTQSCGDKSRHINIRYFFIKDVIQRENIDIVHCPTELMIADFFTKPLQGKLFRKLRDFIMGLTDDISEERVGKQNETIIGETDQGGETRISQETNDEVTSEKKVTFKDMGHEINGQKQAKKSYLEVAREAMNGNRIGVRKQ